MSRRMSAIDRLVVLVVGLLVLAGGVYALLWAFEVPLANQLGEYYDGAALESFFTSQWYALALFGLALVSAAIGVSLLIANFRRHSFRSVSSSAGADVGHISVSTTRLAATIGEQLQRNPDVTSVRTTQRTDRGRPTITWAVNAHPDVRMPQLLEEIEQAESDLRLALPGVDVDSRYLIQLRPVEAN